MRHWSCSFRQLGGRFLKCCEAKPQLTAHRSAETAIPTVNGKEGGCGDRCRSGAFCPRFARAGRGIAPSPQTPWRSFRRGISSCPAHVRPATVAACPPPRACPQSPNMPAPSAPRATRRACPFSVNWKATTSTLRQCACPLRRSSSQRRVPVPTRRGASTRRIVGAGLVAPPVIYGNRRPIPFASGWSCGPCPLRGIFAAAVCAPLRASRRLSRHRRPPCPQLRRGPLETRPT